MPLKNKELPLEVGDHVILDQELELELGTAQSSHVRELALVFPKGDHGMVRVVDDKKRQLLVEFRGLLLRFSYNTSWRWLTLYRRSQDSRRRT